MPKPRNTKRLKERKDCSCGCGVSIYKYGTNGIVSRYVKGHQPHAKKSEETKKKISLTKRNSPNTPRGETSPSWQGGITGWQNKIRTSSQYLDWKKSILERDERKCVDCGANDDLQVDHIKPFAYFPELRFELSNGRTLCRECHKLTGTWGVKLRWIHTHQNLV